jgi:hypothetical protein
MPTVLPRVWLPTCLFSGALTEPGSGAADLLADLIILPVERFK